MQYLASRKQWNTGEMLYVVHIRSVSNKILKQDGSTDKMHQDLTNDYI